MFGREERLADACQVLRQDPDAFIVDGQDDLVPC
jgi:hypothetical protein